MGNSGIREWMADFLSSNSSADISNVVVHTIFSPSALVNKQLGTDEFPGLPELFEEDSPIVPFEKLKEEAIRHALKITEGNIVEAARKLKIGRATLYRLMDKYKIVYDK